MPKAKWLHNAENSHHIRNIIFNLFWMDDAKPVQHDDRRL
jgi:hypothetical protein